MSIHMQADTKDLNSNLTAATHAFLQQHCPPGWRIKEKLTGDCGRRTYTRLACPGGSNLPSTVLLMHTPDTDELHRFCALARYLETHTLRAPRVLASDGQHRALIEDFGDVTVKKALEASQNAWPLVQKTLVTLVEKTYTATPPDKRADKEKLSCPVLDMAFLLEEVYLFVEWACPLLGHTDQDPERVMTVWRNMLTPLETTPFGSVLTLRDVHSENLMILENEAAHMCGVLDFQDAMWGPPAYDVVSMLQDVRVPFDVESSEKKRHQIVQHITEDISISPEALAWPYDLLGLQRAVKIFGVFSRLTLKDKNTSMLRYLPNTARWILHGLRTPSVPTALREWFHRLDLLTTLKVRHDLV